MNPPKDIPAVMVKDPEGQIAKEVREQLSNGGVVILRGVKRCCSECGGTHEQSGARSDCISHWKRRAIEAENAVLVAKIFGLPGELQRWLDGQTITSENIGEIRRRCFLPWDSAWNAIVRDETAERENRPKTA